MRGALRFSGVSRLSTPPSVASETGTPRDRLVRGSDAAGRGNKLPRDRPPGGGFIGDLPTSGAFCVPPPFSGASLTTRSPPAGGRPDSAGQATAIRSEPVCTFLQRPCRATTSVAV